MIIITIVKTVGEKNSIYVYSHQTTGKMRVLKDKPINNEKIQSQWKIF